MPRAHRSKFVRAVGGEKWEQSELKWPLSGLAIFSTAAEDHHVSPSRSVFFIRLRKFWKRSAGFLWLQLNRECGVWWAMKTRRFLLASLMLQRSCPYYIHLTPARVCVQGFLWFPLVSSWYSVCKCTVCVCVFIFYFFFVRGFSQNRAASQKNTIQWQ